MEVYGYAPWGYEGHLVRVEVDLHRGIPGLELVGLPGNAVREARDRIRVAMTRSGLIFPHDRMLVNLSPADVPKSGSGYDLPLALALLGASGQWNPPPRPIFAMGELSLDGRIRKVSGTLAGVMSAQEKGIRHIAVPLEAAQEASSVANVSVVAASTLSELLRQLSLDALPHSASLPTETETPWIGEFPLRGQPRMIRALQASATGGHSMLLYGPPGGGKSLAARSLQGLMPSWTGTQALETSRIWSLAGKLSTRDGLLARRPFRDPHHSASTEGLLGGGPQLLPGEISLAHGGILFLDEAPEFSPKVLQGLREPLETQRIQVIRAGRSAWFPAKTILVLTANGCPCGQTGKEQGVCFCSGSEVRKYWDRIGNALLDRVDLRLHVTPAPPSEVLEAHPVLFEDVRAPVERAWQFRTRREQLSPPEIQVSFSDLVSQCRLTRSCRDWLTQEGVRRDWSTRGLQSILRVSRTLADLDLSNDVGQVHLEEARDLRCPEEPVPWLN